MKESIILDKYIEDFLNYLKYERKLSDNTYASYRYNLIKISNYFKSENLINLTEDDIRTFLYNCQENSKSKAHYLTVLKSFYNYLIDEEIIKINPCKNA